MLQCLCISHVYLGTSNSFCCYRSHTTFPGNLLVSGHSSNLQHALLESQHLFICSAAACDLSASKHESSSRKRASATVPELLSAVPWAPCRGVVTLPRDRRAGSAGQVGGFCRDLVRSVCCGKAGHHVAAYSWSLACLSLGVCLSRLVCLSV